MMVINPKVICYYLKIDLLAISHRQKMTTLNLERYEALKEEVQKLIANGFIREAIYSKWVSNLVLVKKHNRKWHFYIDFFDPNRACPKNSFSLPQIDQLVGSMVGH